MNSLEQIETSKAAEALRTSEVRYRRLFESAKDGILILNAETGMVVDVNPFLVELLGFSREEFLGKNIWELGFFKDIFANKEKFLELQKKGYIRYDNLPLKTTDGRKIAVEFVSNVYQENSHKVIQCNIRVLGVLRGTTLPNPWGAWSLLAVGLIITVIISLYIKAGVESAAQREFAFACNEIRININARLEASAQILRSGAALIDASETVAREEWHTFVQRLQLRQYLPGIQGVGFALLIPREQLDQHVQAIRREGFPDYQVRPAGERESYSAIIYLEPFSDRNLRAFGYDMLSEPVRRAAMERARDENTVALSGKVILVQETGQDFQAGGLMYVPVFRPGLPIETIEQRRAAIQGWVYSPYRMTDLMRGTLRDWDVKQNGKEISLQVYDGDVLSEDTLLYDSQGATDRALASTALITRLTPLDFAGHCWTLRFTASGGLASLADYDSAWLVLFGGTMSTLLLFGLTLWRQQRIRFELNKAAAGEILRASEVRYRRLFEVARDGILILDAETGMVVDVNPFLVELLGFPHAAFLGKKVWELGVFKDIVANQDKFVELQQKGYVRYENLPLETADGRKMQVEFVSNEYLANDVKVIQCNIRDISERKRAEDALRKSEQRFRNIYEKSPVEYQSLDSEGRILDVNSAWLTTFAFTRAEVIGRRLDEFLTPASQIAFAERFPRFRASGATHGGEFEVRCKDGKVLTLIFDGVFVQDSQNRQTYTHCVLHNITERKRVEDALRLSESQLSDALKMAHAGHWEYDVGDDIFTFNDNFYRIFRTTAEKVGGYKMSSADYARRFCHPDDIHLVVKETQAAIETTDPNFNRQLEHRIFYADGEPGYMAVRFFIVKDGQGRTVKTYGVNQDITERKRAEEALRESNMQLQKSLEELKLTQQKVSQQERLSALGQMASGIAHDFNNVLMPIVGFSELLLADPSILDDRNESLHMIEMIFSAGNDARQIVRRLRSVYREEDDADYKLVDISKIVESSISLTMPKWKEEMSAKGVTIEIATDFQPVPRIKGNESEIREVMTNLIFNAVDAMPKGGVITFRVLPRNKIAIALEVTDRGIGMDQETLRRCMEPFFTTKGVQGSGLGLAMVYGIIERHEGVLEIESNPGAGTTIRILFPVPAVTANTKKEFVKASKALSSMRILVIDDEARVRNLIARILKADFHSVILAEDGYVGLDILRRGAFDLVITDRAMPKMSGDEVAKEVQQIRPGMPVIMLSGFGDIMKNSGECPFGVTRVVSKPVTQQELRHVMASVLRKAEGHHGPLTSGEPGQVVACPASAG